MVPTENNSKDVVVTYFDPVKKKAKLYKKDSQSYYTSRNCILAKISSPTYQYTKNDKNKMKVLYFEDV